MLQALITMAATEGEESSKSAFYIAGGVLAGFALVISAIGIRGHETFPPSRGAARAVMLLAAVLVAITMVTAIITG